MPLRVVQSDYDMMQGKQRCMNHLSLTDLKKQSQTKENERYGAADGDGYCGFRVQKVGCINNGVCKCVTMASYRVSIEGNRKATVTNGLVWINIAWNLNEIIK